MNFNLLPPTVKWCVCCMPLLYSFHSDPFYLGRVMKLTPFTIILFNSYLISAKENFPRQCKRVASRNWINLPFLSVLFCRVWSWRSRVRKTKSIRHLNWQVRDRHRLIMFVWSEWLGGRIFFYFKSQSHSTKRMMSWWICKTEFRTRTEYKMFPSCNNNNGLLCMYISMRYNKMFTN